MCISFELQPLLQLIIFIFYATATSTSGETKGREVKHGNHYHSLTITPCFCVANTI